MCDDCVSLKSLTFLNFGIMFFHITSLSSFQIANIDVTHPSCVWHWELTGVEPVWCVGFCVCLCGFECDEDLFAAR